MGRAMYLRQQAEVLLGLSRATIEEVEDAESDFSDMPVGRGGSSSGDAERH